MSSTTLKTIGVTLLIAGCCVGAGMLGLPLLAARVGFFPSVFMFSLVWLFLLTTGLLLLEVNLWFEERVNLLSMVEETLGARFRTATWFLFLFLFYCILVAYFGGGSEVITELLPIGKLSNTVPSSYLFFGLITPLLLLNTHAIDLSNRFLTGGLILTFLLIIGFGINDVEVANLNQGSWSASYSLLPLAVVSFGYHNLIPTITHYLKRDPGPLRLSIIVGTLIPLVCYLLWEFVILGISSPEELLNVASKNEGGAITTILRNAAPLSLVNPCLKAFTFCAISSSFLSVGISCVDFLSDGLGIEKKGIRRLFLWGLVTLPPFAISQTYPHLFLQALGVAGAYGAVTLYGIFPVLMVWKGRYIQKRKGVRLVAGGKATLFTVIVFSFAIILAQLIADFG